MTLLLDRGPVGVCDGFEQLAVKTRHSAAMTRRIEFLRIVVRALREEIAAAVRAGHNPQAAVLHRGFVDRDPGPAQRAIAGGNVNFVLVPGLTLEVGRLDEQHRLHALHGPIPGRQVRADDLR